MNPPTEITMLRLYVSSADIVKRTPVYEALAYAAKRYGMAGCTVYKGLMAWRTNRPVVPQVLGNRRKSACHCRNCG